MPALCFDPIEPRPKCDVLRQLEAPIRGARVGRIPPLHEIDSVQGPGPRGDDCRGRDRSTLLRRYAQNAPSRYRRVARTRTRREWPMRDVGEITGFHAHVYFDAATR